MNATQRNFVINLAMEMMGTKLLQLKKRLWEENNLLGLSEHVPPKVIHAAIKNGKVKLRPVSKLTSTANQLEDFYDLTSLKKKHNKDLVAAGYHFTGAGTVILLNPIMPSRTVYSGDNFYKVAEASEKCNKYLLNLAKELMLGDCDEAHHLLEDIESLSL